MDHERDKPEDEFKHECALTKEEVAMLADPKNVTLGLLLPPMKRFLAATRQE